MSDAPRIKVGVGVWIMKDGKVLMGRRLVKNHSDGTFASPGGHLEFGESFEDCARREAMEEAGVEIDNIRVVTVSNLLVWEGKHYVDIGIVADWKSGVPEVREPDKCSGWEWVDPKDLREPLMVGDRLRVEAIETGKWYFGTIQ